MNSLIYLFLFHTLGSKLQVNGQNETGQMPVSVWGWVGGKEEGEQNPGLGLLNVRSPLLLSSLPLVVPKGLPRTEGF